MSEYLFEQKKNWQSTRREQLAASWTSEVKIFNFVPLHGRYIKMVFSRPSVIEKNWLDLFSTPQTQKKSQFLNPNAGNCIFWNFQKNPILGWFFSLKPLCWPQFWPQRSLIWFPSLSLNWGRCQKPNQEHGEIWYHICVNLNWQPRLSEWVLLFLFTDQLQGWVRLHTHLNNYTKPYVNLLFGLVGIYNFGGVLVNPTEGYFQVNGYSFSSPAKNDVSE